LSSFFVRYLMSRISQNLIALKKERNLLQKDIAQAVGVSLRAYQYYERGEREPASETILKLADYFNVPTDFLLGVGLFENWEEIEADWDNILEHIKPYLVKEFPKLAPVIDAICDNKYLTIQILNTIINKLEISHNPDSINIVWKY